MQLMELNDQNIYVGKKVKKIVQKKVNKLVKVIALRKS